MLNLRKYVAPAAGALVGAAMAFPAVAADAITVVSWGGAYTKSQIEAMHKPFAEKTGIKVNSEDYNGGLGQVKAQVDANNVVWDVVDFELSDAIRGCEQGLLMPIDPAALPPAPDGTPATEDFIDGALQECGVANIVWTTAFAYDKSKFPNDAPKSIVDVFDVQKFPGKRGMRKSPRSNLEWALMADGVPYNEVYQVLSTPEGLDRAFAKLDTIKDHVVWWEAGAQPPQMLAAAEVVITSAYNGRIFDAAAVEKKPFEIIWDGHTWDIDLFAIPKGTKNPEAAMEFIKYATGTQALADQAKWISYGPARKSSIPLIGTHAVAGVDMKPHMPTAPDNFKTAIMVNFDFWADNQASLDERFAAWLAK